MSDIPGVADAGWTPQRHPAPNFKMLLSTGATYDARDPEGLSKWVPQAGLSVWGGLHAGPVGVVHACWPAVWCDYVRACVRLTYRPTPYGWGWGVHRQPFTLPWWLAPIPSPATTTCSLHPAPC